MKILLSIPPSETAGGGESPRAIHTIPDTALHKAKVPFFIPDFAPRCTAHLALAVRINRLGRSIHAKFAPRYYDAVTPAIHFTAHPLLEQLKANGLPWDMAFGFDDALSVGEFTSADEALKTGSIVCEAHRNGNQALSFTFGNTREAIAEFIERASSYYIFRQGDILLLPATPDGFDVAIDDRIEARINGTTTLTFNVK